MRDYDPTTGRYLQADPLGLVDGASVYGYALQNPLRYTDPRGEFAVGLGAFAGPAGLAFALAAWYLAANWDELCDGFWWVWSKIVPPEGWPNNHAGDQDMGPENGPPGGPGGPGLGSAAGTAAAITAATEAAKGWNDESNYEDEDPDEIYEWTGHAIDEMMSENISPDDIYDAIQNPINIRPGDNNTTVFDGTHASASVDTNSLLTPNPRIVTVWRD